MSVVETSATPSEIPADMKRTIILYTGGLGVEGFFGVFTPHWDVPIIIGAWTAMFGRLYNQAGTRLDKHTRRKIAAGVFLGIGGIAGGVKVANTTLAYTGVGTGPAMVANAGTNAIVTYLVGYAAARVFLSTDPGTPAREIVKAILALIVPTPRGPGGGS